MDVGRVRVPGGADGPPNFVAWLREHPYLAAFLVGSVVMAVLVFRKKTTEFEWAYVLTARHLVDGRGIYGLDFPPFRSFTYPPFMALLSIPFAYMPKYAGRGAWYLVNLASLLVVWRGSWKLAGGGRLEGPDPGRIDRREHLVAVFGLACALPYLQSGVAHQQTDLLITALLIAGCLALRRSRGFLAATSFGLAAGMKCTPLLWAPYLAWRGRWKAAAWLVAVAVGVNLLPNLVSVPKGGGWWALEWFERFLRPMGASTYLPGQWYAWILDNQSLAGTFTRLATTRFAWQADGLAILDRSSPLGAGMLRPLIYGVEAALLLVAWYALRRRRPIPACLAGEPGSTRDAIEYGMVLMLMLLFSPMSSRPHFATMLLPALCLARLAVYGKRVVLSRLLHATIATSLLSLPFLGRSVGRLTMWGGVLTWGASFLLLGCLWVLLAGTRKGEGPGRNHLPGRGDASGAAGPHGVLVSGQKAAETAS